MASMASVASSLPAGGLEPSQRLTAEANEIQAVLQRDSRTVLLSKRPWCDPNARPLTIELERRSVPEQRRSRVRLQLLVGARGARADREPEHGSGRDDPGPTPHLR